MVYHKLSKLTDQNWPQTELTPPAVYSHSTHRIHFFYESRLYLSLSPWLTLINSLFSKLKFKEETICYYVCVCKFPKMPSICSK